MTEDSAKIVIEALESISGECKRTSYCRGDYNCPLFDCCQEGVGLFETSPDCWCFGRRFR